MIREVYPETKANNETDPYHGWIPSAAHYGVPLVRYDFDKIAEEEETCYYSRQVQRSRDRRIMDLHGPDLPDTAWPRNERPCIHMDGGEGLEPYEI